MLPCLAFVLPFGPAAHLSMLPHSFCSYHRRTFIFSLTFTQKDRSLHFLCEACAFQIIALRLNLYLSKTGVIKTRVDLFIIKPGGSVSLTCLLLKLSLSCIGRWDNWARLGAATRENCAAVQAYGGGPPSPVGGFFRFIKLCV